MTLNSAKPIICGKKNSQAGATLIETLIALTILLLVSSGVMSLAAVSMTTTENQGHLLARTTEYAQDKMEQLLALQYPDQRTDTTLFPSAVGTACPPACGLTLGGGLNPLAPVAGYSDYVDTSGNPTVAAGNWQYVRVWQISQAAPNLIQITVLTQVRNGVGQAGLLPQSTVVSLKASPF